MQDIDEAIRLTHASKASLFETTTNRPNEDSITQVYNTLRDLCSKSGTEGVSFSVALNAVLLKGLTERQLLECIEEYEDLGVLSLNDDKTLITIF